MFSPIIQRYITSLQTIPPERTLTNTLIISRQCQVAIHPLARLPDIDPFVPRLQHRLIFSVALELTRFYNVTLK